MRAGFESMTFASVYRELRPTSYKIALSQVCIFISSFYGDFYLLKELEVVARAGFEFATFASFYRELSPMNYQIISSRV